ncbi:MAG: carbohydrate ABC transporter permease [Clostridia bacterium]|nr:carbohydrate ABC transporter permease [Clostridia bacterium]
MLLRRTVGQGAVSVVRGLLLFGLCFMIIQPLLMKLSVSLMEERDLYDTTVTLLPRHPTWANYELTASSSILNYWKSLLNTFWISLTTAILQVAACTLAGYGFARFEFPLKKFWFACVILVIIIPPQTISTSLYMYFSSFDIFGIIRAISGKSLNLRNSFTPYALMSATCMGLKDGLYIFMIRQYFKGIPVSLEEAAYVDGCGSFHTFWKVMLPDALPIMTSCFLFAFVWQWTDRFYTNNFLRGFSTLSGNLPSIQQRLNLLKSVNGESAQVSITRVQQVISTGVIMTIVPLLILYIFAQRGFVESLSTSGLKD